MLREVKLLTQGHTAVSSRWSGRLSRSLSDLEAGALGKQQSDEDGANTSTLQVLLGTGGYNTGKGDEEEENDNSSCFFQHFTIYKMFSHPLSHWIPMNLKGWVGIISILQMKKNTEALVKL